MSSPHATKEAWASIWFLSFVMSFIGLIGLHITDGTKPQGYVSGVDRTTIMKASVPLLAAMLSCAALGETTCNLSTKAQSLVDSKRSSAPALVLVSQTHQKRSDRVVGYWTSSSGAGITPPYPEPRWGSRCEVNCSSLFLATVPARQNNPGIS